MIKNYSSVLLCIAFILHVRDVQSCTRLPKVRGAEIYCWSTQVDLSVKLDQVMSKMEDFAKAQVEVNEKKEPQDCKYYYCVFQQLELLNTKYDVPCIDKLTDWIKNNVDANQATAMLDRAQKCTGELANTMKAGKYFMADNVDNANANHDNDPSEPQCKCEISKEYMKCISVATAGDKCPVLRYP